jgi:hypothetical protein
MTVVQGGGLARRHAACHGVAGQALERIGLMSQTSEAPRTILQKLLEGIEKVGNKDPRPAVIILVLMGVVVLLSHAFSVMGINVSYQLSAN